MLTEAIRCDRMLSMSAFAMLRVFFPTVVFFKRN